MGLGGDLWGWGGGQGVVRGIGLQRDGGGVSGVMGGMGGKGGQQMLVWGCCGTEEGAGGGRKEEGSLWGWGSGDGEGHRAAKRWGGSVGLWRE